MSFDGPREYFKKLAALPREDILFFLWVYSCLLHYLEQPIKTFSVLVIVSFLFLFVRVNRALKIFFVILHTITIFTELPKIANHTVLALFVNLGIFYELLKGRFAKKSSDLFATLGDYVHFLLIVVYFFGVFHKLNTGYFDVNFSCATSFYQKMRGGLFENLLPDSLWVYKALIYLSLVIEFFIFLALFLKPRLALIVAFAFHGLLSFYVFYDFAAILFFCFSLLCFRADAKADSTPRFAPIHFFLFFLSLVPLVLVNVFKFNIFFNPHTFAAVCLLLAYTPLLSAKACSDFAPRSLNRGQVFLIGVFVLNGLTPYLGIKTTSNFSMFSNLRVEGEHFNHLVARRSWQIFDYTNDLVWIEDAVGPEEEWIYTQKLGLPFKEVQRVATELRLQKFPVFKLRYTRGGKTYDLKDALSDVETIPSLSTLERKLIGYRTLRKDGIAACQW